MLPCFTDSLTSQAQEKTKQDHRKQALKHSTVPMQLVCSMPCADSLHLSMACIYITYLLLQALCHVVVPYSFGTQQKQRRPFTKQASAMRIDRSESVTEAFASGVFIWTRHAWRSCVSSVQNNSRHPVKNSFLSTGNSFIQGFRVSGVIP